jgi:hypothetical protein
MSPDVCRPLGSLILAAGIVFAMSLSARADDRAGQVIDVDSWGTPAGIGRADHPQYFVWQDEQGWHVRTDTAGKRQEFNIEIETVGTHLETGELLGAGRTEKTGPTTDGGRIGPARRTIKARFVTSVKTDGIDFTVDANTKEVRFQLLINGEERPQWIALGANQAHPPSAAFALANKKARTSIRSELSDGKNVERRVCP